jgi:hypothetical protein
MLCTSTCGDCHDIEDKNRYDTFSPMPIKIDAINTANVQRLLPRLDSISKMKIVQYLARFHRADPRPSRSYEENTVLSGTTQVHLSSNQLDQAMHQVDLYAAMHQRLWFLFFRFDGLSLTQYHHRLDSCSSYNTFTSCTWQAHSPALGSTLNFPVKKGPLNEVSNALTSKTRRCLLFEAFNVEGYKCLRISFSTLRDCRKCWETRTRIIQVLTAERFTYLWRKYR